MIDSNNFVVVDRERYAELERKEERIEIVRRLYESGNCYTLDTALSALGIKIKCTGKIALHGDLCVDDGDLCVDDGDLCVDDGK